MSADLRSRRGLAGFALTLHGRTFTGRGHAVHQPDGSYLVNVYVREGEGRPHHRIGYGAARRAARAHWVAGLTSHPQHRLRYSTLTAAVVDVTRAAVAAHAMAETRDERAVR